MRRPNFSLAIARWRATVSLSVLLLTAIFLSCIYRTALVTLSTMLAASCSLLKWYVVNKSPPSHRS